MLSYELNSKLIKLAPKFTARDIAPDTFARLASNSTAGLVVWSGASDETIYGDPSVNWAMRAWHDSLHLEMGCQFDSIGERRVALEQARVLGGRLGDIILVDVFGQVEYFNKHGIFPTNQVEFLHNQLKGLV